MTVCNLTFLLMESDETGTLPGYSPWYLYVSYLFSTNNFPVSPEERKSVIHFDKFVGNDSNMENELNTEDEFGGEYRDVPLLPDHEEQKTVSSLRQRKKYLDEQKKLDNEVSWEKWKGRIPKCIPWIGAKIFPTWWFYVSIESESDHFAIVDWLRDLWSTYWKICVFSLLGTLVSIYWISSLFYDPGTISMMHLLDNQTVTNVYHPKYPRIFDIENPVFNAWLKVHQEYNGPLDLDVFADQYFSSPVYVGYQPSSEFVKNITFDGLVSQMKQACPRGGCMCISATHLGIPVNIILINEIKNDHVRILVDPDVKLRSPETFQAVYGTDMEKYEERPVSVIIEYKKVCGIRERETFIKHEGACISKCIEIGVMYRHQ